MSLLGQPADKNWVLMPNYADKILMINYLAYKLTEFRNLLPSLLQFCRTFLKRYRYTPMQLPAHRPAGS